MFKGSDQYHQQPTTDFLLLELNEKNENNCYEGYSTNILT